MNAEFVIARFKHKKDNEPQQDTVAWPALCAELTRHQVRREKDGPLWSPTRYATGTTRGKANVEALYCLVLDFDSGVTPEELIDGWERWAYCYASTYSHDAAGCRWRAVFPLARPVPAEEWPRVYAKLAAYFGASATDPSCKDASRIYYLPAKPPNRESFTAIHEGEWLDPDEFPELEAPRPRRATVHAGGNGNERVSERVLIGRAQKRVPVEGRNSAGMWLACQLRDNDYSETEAEAVAWAAYVDPVKIKADGTADAYTEQEWRETVRKAYRRPKRDPWPELERNGNGHHTGRRFTDNEAPEEPFEDDLQHPAAVVEVAMEGAEEGEDGEGNRGPSDETLAKHFAAECRHRLLYMDGDQWFFYQKSGAWTRRNYEHVERMMFDWLEARNKKADRRASISARKIGNVIRLAKNRLGPNSMEVLDARTDWIPVQNGILDLATGKLLPHSPRNRITRILPFSYDADAKCPRWLQFLDETLVETDRSTPCVPWQEVLQEWFGYCLIPTSRAQTSMFWLGSGANGKGIAQKVLEAIVGKAQVASILMEKLAEPYHLAHLHGKLLATISEIDRQAMRKTGQMLKAIIGGDMVNGRRIGENPFDFTPTVRVVVTCNAMPRTDDTSEGYFRRVLPIEWRRNFEEDERDTHLEEKLLTELPGILNWALVGLRRWEERGGRFEMPEESRKLLNEYRTAEDNVKRFVEECCTRDVNAAVHTKALYLAYSSYCSEGGEAERRLTKDHFCKRLAAMGFNAARPYILGKQDRGFYGLQLGEPDAEGES